MFIRFQFNGFSKFKNKSRAPSSAFSRRVSSFAYLKRIVFFLVLYANIIAKEPPFIIFIIK